MEMALSYHSTVLSAGYHPVVGVSPAVCDRGFLIVAIDEQHVALPKLYGAPAYARPPRAVSDTEKPFDPDDLPIEAVRSDEERELVATLPAEAFAPGGSARREKPAADAPSLSPRPLSLRALAGRLRGPTGN
jgi:hypothetical protein